MEKFLVAGLFNLYTRKRFGRMNETILVPAKETAITDILSSRKAKVLNRAYYPLVIGINNKLYHAIPVAYNNNTSLVTVRLISNLRTNDPEEFWNTDDVASSACDSTVDVSSSYPFNNVIRESAGPVQTETEDEYGLYHIQLNKIYQVSYGVSTGRVQYAGPLAELNNQIMTNLYNGKPEEGEDLVKEYGIKTTGAIYNKQIAKWYQALIDHYDEF